MNIFIPSYTYPHYGAASSSKKSLAYFGKDDENDTVGGPPPPERRGRGARKPRANAPTGGKWRSGKVGLRGQEGYRKPEPYSVSDKLLGPYGESNQTDT